MFLIILTFLLIGFRLNCVHSRKTRDSSSEIYERVHLENKKTKNKKCKLTCLKPTLCLFDYLTSKFDHAKSTSPEPELQAKNAFTNELYTYSHLIGDFISSIFI